jgi:glycosyltransferase involved in cell wall biosynthesis
MQKITIIISAQDSTEKLDGCLDSIANQDLQDIEIICLLNGSKDDAPLALEAYSDRGTRLVPVFCDESLGRMHAKKAGVDQAFGEYILFLDGNCRLQPWACSELYEKIRDCEADILQFSTEEENAGGPVYYNTPYYGTLLNKDITEACFVEQRYRYSLWDKLFSAELVKKAFSHIPGADCPIENDCFPYFYLSFFARRFCGYIGESCCRYLEHGHMRSEPNLGMLERFCSQVKVAKSLEIFLKDQGQYDEYEGAQKAIGENVVNTCIEKWHDCLPMELFAGGFDMLLDYCGVEKTISGLASKYWNKRVEIAGRIRGGRALNAKPTRLKTIVIHYFRYCFGGVGRVMSALIPMWIDMGYRVILLTDTPPMEIDYPLDPRSERIVLHDVKSKNRDEYALRARQWSDIPKRSFLPYSARIPFRWNTQMCT